MTIQFRSLASVAVASIDLNTRLAALATLDRLDLARNGVVARNGYFYAR